MKKSLITTTLFILLITFAAVAAADNNICDNVDMHWLQNHVPIPPAEIVEKSPINGLCQVILEINGQMVPVFTGNDFVIAGEMFQDKKQMTEEKITALKSKAIKENMGELEDVVAMSYAPENASGKVVYMLTDPLCPYCNTAGEQLKGIADETGTTFKLVMSNVHGPDGENKIKEALCKNFTFEQYIAKEWKLAQPEQYDCPEADALWTSSSKMMFKLGVRGLPAFITQDGQIISGANMPALKAAIGKMTTGQSEVSSVDTQPSCSGSCNGGCTTQCGAQCDNPCAKKQG